jgi:hypothetical protein
MINCNSYKKNGKITGNNCIFWSGIEDSNLRPRGPKPRALANCANPRIKYNFNRLQTVVTVYELVWFLLFLRFFCDFPVESCCKDCA